MDVTRLFFDFLNKFVAISNEEFEHHFLPIIKVRRYAKKEFLIKAGDVEHHFNFVLKGMAGIPYQQSRSALCRNINRPINREK